MRLGTVLALDPVRLEFSAAKTQSSIKETHMNTQITSKITALAVALMMNALIMVGVGYLFDGQSHPQASMIALASTAVQSAGEAA
jgi:hypothetical protein